MSLLPCNLLYNCCDKINLVFQKSTKEQNKK
jgi:hypothetical protein